MKIYPSPKARHFYLVAVLSAGLNIPSPAFANSYLFGPRPDSLKGLGAADAKAFNDIGQVVGTYSTPDGSRHGFITGPDATGRKTLATLGGPFIDVVGINATGQVAGTSLTAKGSRHAFITGPDGTGITDIGTLGGRDSEARGINASGQIIGVSTTGAGSSHGFITGRNGKGMTDLGDFEPRGINSAGEVVGYSEGRAFLVNSNGTARTDLGVLHDVSVVEAVVRDVPVGGINDASQVIVNSESCPFYPAPCGYTASVIGPNGFEIVEAELRGINNAGEALGIWMSHNGPRTPFVTFDGVSFGTPSEGGPFTWPSLQGVVVTDLFAINNPGQMLAVGNGPDLIPPVPEPETYAMFMAGLALMGFIIRQRQLRSHSGTPPNTSQ